MGAGNDGSLPERGEERMKRTYWFEAKDWEEAVKLAEAALKLPREKMTIEEVKKGRFGFLGLGGSPEIIKVTVDDGGKLKDWTEDIDGARDETEADVDGKVGIRNGKFLISPPKGIGKFPVVVPCPGVVLLVNGVRCMNPTVVVPSDEINCFVEETETENLPWKVEISPDGLKAYLTVFPHMKVRRRLRDAEPVQRLEIMVEEWCEPLPEPSLDEVLAALAEKGIVYGLKEEEIKRAVVEKKGEPVLVAEGKAPMPGQDGYLDFLYLRSGAKKHYDEQGKIDFREVSREETVEAGEVVARVVEPVPGRPGMTVTGKEIPVKEPKPFHFRLGKGVVQVEDKIVATLGGRPRIIGSVVEVLPVLVVQGDVALDTGNIRFPGDVVVKGGVRPGMKVVADGLVEVWGPVEKAEIVARDGVIILSSVFSSRVRAGGGIAEISRVLPVAKQILNDLEVLKDAVEQVNARLEMRREMVEMGRVVEILVERKFKRLPARVKELIDLAQEKGLNLKEDELKMFREIADLVLYPIFHAGDAGTERVAGIVEHLRRWVADGEEKMKKKAEVYLKYALNSEIFATGSITVDGQGCYNTLLSSGDRVRVQGEKGVFRGGEIFAAQDVYVKELGSRGGSTTRVHVPAGRKVMCAKVVGNTLIAVGRRSIRLDEPVGPLAVYQDKEGNIRMR